MEENKELFGGFEGFDRFDLPCGLKRVTAGRGGEAILIDTFEKTVLIDCGMAYCADKVIDNIKAELKGRSLDYILITHSHYDHMGALSEVQKAFPEAITAASLKTSKVLQSQGARKVMQSLSQEAADLYSDVKKDITIGDMKVDLILEEGNEIDLGGASVRTLETKGHTDCSLTFFLEPLSVMFTSESTGVLENEHKVHSAILKSYTDCRNSALKCMAEHAEHIILPHYGYIPPSFNERYFEMYLKQIDSEKDIISELYSKGLSEEEVLEKYVEINWDENRSAEQPFEAFITNARVTVKVLKTT